MIGRSQKSVCRCLSALSLLLASASFSQAVTINVFYDEANSTPPSTDQNGTLLVDIMLEAANYWGTIIEDPWIVNIEFMYRPPFEFSSPSETYASALLTSQQTGKPFTGRIRWNSAWDFFYDATPDLDEEYALASTYYGFLDSSDQSAFYNGNPPEYLEVGYTGMALSPPPPGDPDPAAEARLKPDALSIALHEIGHLLGFTNHLGLNTVETLDGDYDIDPNFLRGAAVGVIESGVGHLADDNTLMFDSLGAGRRKRVSQVDALAAGSSTANWDTINPLRRSFLGGTDFGDPFNWTGTDAPRGIDDAVVGKTYGVSPFAATSGAMFFKSLNINDGAWITLDHDVTVFESTVIGAVYDEGDEPRLRVRTGGSLETDGLRVLGDSTLQMLGGFVDVKGEFNLSAQIIGEGTILVGDKFVNNGKISPQGGTLLMTTLSPSTVPVWDLDGTAGEDPAPVEAIDGDLHVFGSHEGPYNNEMYIGPGREIRFNKPFEFGNPALLQLTGNAAAPATFIGDLTEFGGIVSPKGRGVLDGVLQIFPPSARVLISEADDVLELAGTSLFRRPLITGDGTLRQLGDIIVDGDTIVQVEVFDWGNSTPGDIHETTVYPSVNFQIRSPSTGTTDNEYRGTIRLNNGILTVETDRAWRLPSDGGAGDATPGVLILHNDRESPTLPQVRGQTLTLGGLLQATGGRSEIQTTLVAHESGEIDVQTAAELSLEGPTTYFGPLVHGAGTLVQNGDSDVVFSTTIGTNIYDWDGDASHPSDTVVTSGAVLTINSSQIEMNTADGYDGHVTIADLAALIVNTSGSWGLDGTMTLEGQSTASPGVIVDGADLTNYGTIEGNGRIQSSLENHGTLSPGMSPGVLEFEAGFTLTSDSVVEIELGGLTPIAEFDQIVVNPFGTANLGGGLNVSLIDGFVPQDGDAFTILTAGAVNGTFLDGAVAGVNLPPGLTIDVIYNPQSVILMASATGLPGDFDNDGDVDGRDFLVWQRGGSPTPLSAGDLADWQGNYGVGPLTASTAVPEPSSLGLLFFIVAGISEGINRPKR